MSSHLKLQFTLPLHPLKKSVSNLADLFRRSQRTDPAEFTADLLMSSLIRVVLALAAEINDRLDNSRKRKFEAVEKSNFIREMTGLGSLVKDVIIIAFSAASDNITSGVLLLHYWQYTKTDLWMSMFCLCDDMRSVTYNSKTSTQNNFLESLASVCALHRVEDSSVLKFAKLLGRHDREVYDDEFKEATIILENGVFKTAFDCFNDFAGICFDGEKSRADVIKSLYDNALLQQAEFFNRLFCTSFKIVEGSWYENHEDVYRQILRADRVVVEVWNVCAAIRRAFANNFEAFCKDISVLLAHHCDGESNRYVQRFTELIDPRKLARTRKSDFAGRMSVQGQIFCFEVFWPYEHVIACPVSNQGVFNGMVEICKLSHCLRTALRSFLVKLPTDGSLTDLGLEVIEEFVRWTSSEGLPLTVENLKYAILTILRPRMFRSLSAYDRLQSLDGGYGPSGTILEYLS